jgi:protein phosphatase
LTLTPLTPPEGSVIIPSQALVCLVGASGSGKSTFARRHFKPTQILSSDHFRALIADSESDQSVSADAFSCLYHLAKKRLKHGRLTVIDATSVNYRARKRLLDLAETYNKPAIAIVFNPSLKSCLAMNEARPDRQVPPDIVEKQINQLLDSLKSIDKEGFQLIYKFYSHKKAKKATVVIDPNFDPF